MLSSIKASHGTWELPHLPILGGREQAYSGLLALRITLFARSPWVPVAGGVQGFAVMPCTFSDA